jgi:hyperosmotically inducible protein
MSCVPGFLGQGFAVKNLAKGEKALGENLYWTKFNRERRLKMRQSYRGFFIVFFLAFVLGLTGCQQEGTAEKAGQKIDQAAESAGKKIEKAGEAVVEKAEKAGEYMDDSAITAKIKAEILSDPLLKVSQISVITTNGVVRLSGTIDSQQSIDRAMEIARSVKNVKSVENELIR